MHQWEAIYILQLVSKEFCLIDTSNIIIVMLLYIVLLIALAYLQ